MKRREEKRREEKRREIYNQGGAPKILTDLNKNGSNEDEKVLENPLVLKDITKNKNANNGIVDNARNQNKNEILRNMIFIRNGKINIKFLIITRLFIIILSYNKNNLIEFEYSNIIIRNKLTEIQNIFSSYTYFFKITNHPNTIYINGNEKITIKPSHYLEQKYNSIELFQDGKKDDWKNIFYYYSDIIQNNLTNLATSNCSSMIEVLATFSSLLSLNKSNFDISQMTSNRGTFKNCSSLISLNLSNINFLNVMSLWYMFFDYTNLEYINLKLFKETNLVSSFRTIFYEKLFDKIIIILYFVISKMLITIKLSNLDDKREEKRREEKRREEKRREEKRNLYPGQGPEN